LPLADARRAMPDVKLSAAEMKLAELVVTQAMAGTFDPHSIKDERSDKLLALINMAAQSAGAVVKATAPEPDDLMAKLQATIANGKKPSAKKRVAIKR
jgi:non-homologous end joining protein Ku